MLMPRASSHFVSLFSVEYVFLHNDSWMFPDVNDLLIYRAEILLEVSSGSDQPSDHHRVIWCPYIPDEQASGGVSSDEADDPAYLLVLTHGPCVGHQLLLLHQKHNFSQFCYDLGRQ